MKTNYSELERRYGVFRQTIAKYNNGFEKKQTRDKKIKLDDYKNEIEEKVNLPGATITGVYNFI